MRKPLLEPKGGREGNEQDAGEKKSKCHRIGLIRGISSEVMKACCLPLRSVCFPFRSRANPQVFERGRGNARHSG